MILLTIIISFVLIFLSGLHWSAYKIDSIEERPNAYKSMWWSIACGVIGLYHLVSLVGLSVRNYQ